MNNRIEEVLRDNGVFRSSIAPFKEEVQDAMRDYATEMAVNFLDWVQSEKWVYHKVKYYKGLSEQTIVTSKELYVLFESALAGN
jgi:hypothetical protein